MPIHFDQLIHPLTPKEFRRDYFGKRVLHTRNLASKAGEVMDLQSFSEALSVSKLWTPDSLQLILETRTLPATAYCSAKSTEDSTLVTDPQKIRAWIQRGASILLADIGSIGPGIRNFVHMLQESLRGKAQANAYFSARNLKAFPPHFDYHEVFALHLTGQKTWRIYEGKEDRPIPGSERLSPEEMTSRAGRVAEEITLNPGDLLYLPRGQYHDALADRGGTLHIAFGLTLPTYHSVLKHALGTTIQRPEFRDYLDFDASTQSTVEHLSTRLDGLLGDSFHGVLDEYRKEFGFGVATLDPADVVVENPAYFVSKGVSITTQGGRKHLTGSGSSVALPVELADPVGWVLQREQLSAEDLRGAFPSMSRAQIEKLINDLLNMSVLY